VTFDIGSVSQSVDLQIVDDDGLPVSGLVAATFPDLAWSRAGAHASVAFPALTDLALITTEWAAGGVKERSGGRYRVDLPNAIFAAAGVVQIVGEVTGKHVIIGALEVADLLTAAGVASALGSPIVVHYMTCLVSKDHHRFYRGAAFTRSLENAPNVRLAKDLFPGLSLESELDFRIRVHQQPEIDAVVAPAFISQDSDEDYWLIEADLSSEITTELEEGEGTTQFWHLDAAGVGNDAIVAEFKLTVKHGNNVT
jgi:hypothetical protein